MCLFKEIDAIEDPDIRDQINYILHLVDIGFVDPDQAIHEIKELIDIYGI